MTEILARRKLPKNRFILQNHQRSWSGWTSFSRNSSSNVVIRRNLRIRSQKSNNNTSSCKFDTVRGGCRKENLTLTFLPSSTTLSTTDDDISVIRLGQR